MTAPVVVPVNGSAQIAVIPNSFTISFTITPHVPAMDITWSLSGIDITDNPGLFRQLSNDRLSLTINPVTSLDQGVFRLEASNSFGVGSATVSLSVQSELILDYVYSWKFLSFGLLLIVIIILLFLSGEPIFQDRPEDVKIHERLNTTFECFATGVPTVEINWFFKGSRIIPEGGNKYFIGPFGDDNYGSLTIYNLEFTDAGMYTCEANNTHGSDSTTAMLEVQGLFLLTVIPLWGNNLCFHVKQLILVHFHVVLCISATEGFYSLKYSIHLVSIVMLSCLNRILLKSISFCEYTS